MADTSRRMLLLLSLLQTGRGWTGTELAERLGVSARTLRRDVERLRQLGYPTETRPGPGGFYLLRAGTAMPPLLLTDDEAIAVAASLRMTERLLGDSGAGERAGRKLEQVLPKRLRRQLEAIAASTETSPDIQPGTDPLVLGAVAAAAAEHRRIRFLYRNRAQRVDVRLVDPYRQVFRRRHWYLLAWDTDRGDWRTFRLDRITDVEATQQTYRVQDLPAETATQYLDDGMNAPRHRAVLVFHAGAQQMSDLLTNRDGTLEPLTEQRCRYTTWVDSFEWLAVSTVILDVDFHIEEPPGFVAYSAALAKRLSCAGTAR